MYKRISSYNVKSMFKYLGMLFMTVSFLILIMGRYNYFLGYDISTLMQTVFVLLFAMGLFYLILIDTHFFKIKPLNSILIRSIDDVVLEIRLSKESKTIDVKNLSPKKRKAKYPKRGITQLKFKPSSELADILENTKDLFYQNSKEEFLKLLESENVKHKIQLLKGRNVFTYQPIFDFLDKVVDGGINAFYGDSRREFLKFIVEKFSKNEKSFDTENLRKRYQDWLDGKNANSDIYFVVNQSNTLSEFRQLGLF